METIERSGDTLFTGVEREKENLCIGEINMNVINNSPVSPEPNEGLPMGDVDHGYDRPKTACSNFPQRS
jgi:hypothetical protein